jgi:hypothetical protein
MENGRIAVSRYPSFVEFLPTVSERRLRLAGLYAVVAAVASFVLTPLLALSYFATEDGADELKTGTVEAWPTRLATSPTDS